MVGCAGAEVSVGKDLGPKKNRRKQAKNVGHVLELPMESPRQIIVRVRREMLRGRIAEANERIAAEKRNLKFLRGQLEQLN